MFIYFSRFFLSNFSIFSTFNFPRLFYVAVLGLPSSFFHYTLIQYKRGSSHFISSFSSSTKVNSSSYDVVIYDGEMGKTRMAAEEMG